jgi:hypothetical protein
MTGATLLPVSPSVLSSQSIGTMKQPQTSSFSSQFLIQEIEMSAGAKSGEYGECDNMGIPHFAKNSSHRRAEDIGPTFKNLRSNAMN